MLYVHGHCPKPKKSSPTSWLEDEGPDRDLDVLKEPENPSTQPPDGGLRAWLVVFAAFSATTCTAGYINSFGVYQTYLSTHFLSGYTASEISWIGSLQLFLLFLGGAGSGPLADRYGVKIVVAPACAVMVLSVMMTSLCTQYTQFILAHGVLGGMACGMIYTPAISVVGQYFSRHRAFAMGVASCGAPVGGVLFPIALNRLLNFPNLGFGWAVRIAGFIMLALLASTSILLTEIAPRRKGQFFTPSAFKSSAYIAISVASFMAMLGLFTPLFYISSYSVQRGMSLQLATYQISILNFASIFGRNSLGYLADRIGRYNAMFLTMASSAILIFCWISTDSVASITLFSAFYGFFSGSVITLYPPCIAQIAPSPSHIATYVGMGMATISLGCLAGTPINGALVHSYPSYTQAAIFSGVVMSAGACLTAVARLTIERALMVVV